MKFCSHECYSKNKIRRVSKNCLKCEKTFSVHPYKKAKRLYCSKICSSPINRAKGNGSEKWKEAYKRMGIRMRTHPEKLYNWKGGTGSLNAKIRRSIEMRQWRELVFKRDDYRCFDCGARSEKGTSVILNADHILRFSKFPRLRFDINNGRTLCKDCHRIKTISELRKDKKLIYV